jgi:hypothetical protein
MPYGQPPDESAEVRFPKDYSTIVTGDARKTG